MTVDEILAMFATIHDRAALVAFLAPLPTRWVILTSWLVDDWRNPRIVCFIVAPGGWM